MHFGSQIGVFGEGHDCHHDRRIQGHQVTFQALGLCETGHHAQRSLGDALQTVRVFKMKCPGLAGIQHRITKTTGELGESRANLAVACPRVTAQAYTRQFKVPYRVGQHFLLGHGQIVK